MNSIDQERKRRAAREPRGARLFSFAVVADTHVNEDEHTCASPFATNARANARARHVFQDIAQLATAPDFVIHLGDIVHPVPGLPAFDEAARRFKEMAAVLPMPLHVVPGNHDVGDKRVDWMPADVVCAEYLDKYRATFGEDYYAVDQGTVRFIYLNALLFNSGLAGESDQMAWLDEQLATATGRVFISLHYPPFLHRRDEKGSYDNIDEPGRGWLLERMAHERVEAVFCGHVHNFWYETVGNAELYMLPSTAFLRHDFSEFYRVPPMDEYGRGDVNKFGYFVVDVYEQGHAAHLVRTRGRSVEEHATSAARDAVPHILAHTKTASACGIAAEMRHPWAEVVEIPCTGGVQEFGRKPARNDYPLMAMWEMGLRTLKIPLQDLAGEETLRRARMMSDVGHGFVTTCLGCPDPRLIEGAARAGVRIDALELNLTQARLAQSADRLRALRGASDAQLIYAKIRGVDDDKHFDGKHYSHFVNTGMRPAELAGADWLRESVAAGWVDGYTVRLDWGTDVHAAHRSLSRQAQDDGCVIWGAVKLAHELASANEDDLAIAALVADAYIAARMDQGVHYAFDTFMDVDRGYFPRNGFIDRRYDPRLAARVLAALNALLPHGRIHAVDVTGAAGAKRIDMRIGDEAYHLVSGPRPAAEALLGGLAPRPHTIDLIEDGGEGAGEIMRLIRP